MIKWTNVRRQFPDTLIAEDALTPHCRAEARLWHRPLHERPWHVDITVNCEGRRTWHHRREYRSLPAAVANYLVARDEAAERLRKTEDN